MQPNNFQIRATQQVMYDLSDRSPDKDNLKRQLQRDKYWKEVGATVITTHRGAGKTVLASQLNALFGSELTVLVDFKNSKSSLRGIDSGKILIVDEYDLIGREALDKILDSANWRHVILIGTLK